MPNRSFDGPPRNSFPTTFELPASTSYFLLTRVGHHKISSRTLEAPLFPKQLRSHIEAYGNLATAGALD
jgi:hypothetical protein